MLYSLYLTYQDTIMTEASTQTLRETKIINSATSLLMKLLYITMNWKTFVHVQAFHLGG